MLRSIALLTILYLFAATAEAQDSSLKENIRRRAINTTIKPAADYSRNSFDTVSLPYISVTDINPRIFRRNDTTWTVSGICKPLKVVQSNRRLADNVPANPENSYRKEWLKGAGEAGYQYFDRSGDITNLPLLQSRATSYNIRMSLLYKESIPFLFYFRYYHSAPFQTEDQYELSIGFDERDFRQVIRDKIISKIKSDFLQKQKGLLATYERVFQQYEEQKQILESPEYIQRAIQARTRPAAITDAGNISTPTINGVPGRTESLNIPNGSLAMPLIGAHRLQLPDSVLRWMQNGNNKAEAIKDDITTELFRRRDSLQQLVRKYEDSLVYYKDNYQKQADSINSELAGITSAAKMKEYATRKNAADSLLSDKRAGIFMRTSLRLGKFIVNNSELTVNNIFLHGISLRYGDEKFVQVTAGYYDFAFREMFRLQVRDSFSHSKQSVMALKFGRTDGKNLSALNIYTGRREKPGALHGELHSIAGISVEKKFYFNRNLQLEAELAKSTTRSMQVADKDKSVLRDLFGGISTRTLGGNALLKTHLPKTKTDAELNWRYMGSQFESFNAGQYFNPQTNLSGRISQPLFKRKLFINTAVRYTNFRSYGIASNIHSKTLFATLNATLRIKKLPVLSAGYYPGSQLYLLESNKLYEYFYYVLNITASHYFMINKLPVQGVINWNKFYNRYSDSAVRSSQSFFTTSWNTWAGKFSFNAGYSVQKLEDIRLCTWEAGAVYGGPVVRAGGSLKWNISGGSTRMGASATAGILLKKAGTINIIYDQSFLPDRTGKFIPVQTAQLQLVKPINFRIWQREQ